MRLREIFRFELVQRFRRGSTWAYLGGLAALVVLLVDEAMVQEARGSGTVHANAPLLIAMTTVLVNMLGLVATADLFGDAAARDFRARTAPFFFTAPLGETRYLGGRFLGAFTVNALLLAVVPAGLGIVQLLTDEPELYGPFRVAAYLQPYLLFTLPSLFAAGALLFAAAAFTGRPLASYGAGAFLFFGSVLNEEGLAELLDHRDLATILDPFGFTALSERFAYWTPFERNTLLVPLEGPLLWNRLLWLGLGALALALVRLRFRFIDARHASRPGRSRRRFPAPAAASGPGGAARQREAVAVPRAGRDFGPRTRWRQVAAVAWGSFTGVLGRRTSLVVAAGAVVFVFGAGWNAWVFLDTPTWPVTSVVTRYVVASAALWLQILIALYAGALVWRERGAGTAELADVTPVPRWVWVAGKLGALGLGIVLLQTVLMAGCLLLQTVQGYRDLEPWLYVRILFGLELPGLLLVAVLALAVHVVVDHEYLGHGLLVLFLAFRSAAPMLGEIGLGVERRLLLYGAAPPWSHSDLSGFEPFLAPFLWHQAYWASWALLLAVAASLSWVRGFDGGPRRRLRRARRRLTRRVLATAAAGLLLVLATGGFVVYNTDILHDYETRERRIDRWADYEHRHGRHRHLPQPRIRRSDLAIEIYPRERRAELAGSHLLENWTDEPIRALHVLIHEDVEVRSLRLDPPAEQVSSDPVHGYHVFTLEPPLEPGATLRLRFAVVFAPRGFPNAGMAAEVVENGTFFDRRWLPIVGYQPELEVRDDRARAEHGLPPRERLPPIDNPEGRRHGSALRDADWIELEAVIGTAADQVAVAPGSLVRSWSENGRRYFHYRTDAPIRGEYAIQSARYAVLRNRWRDVDVEILHHPTHTHALERILRGARASLEYHAEHIGPYPHRQVRIVEFPRHAGTYARAYPVNIAFSEAVGFLARPEGGIDYPFLVAAHEVAHQWWGNQVQPARVAGGPVLGESLAHYGALMAMETAYGREAVRRVLRHLRHGYLVGRQNRRTEEVPLLLSNDQKYIHYDKGALVFHALRDDLGEERVNRALRRFFEAHRFGGAPFPTTRDLYAELREVAPPPLRPLLRDLFEEITLWDLRTTRARIEPTASGEYRLTLEIEAYKVRADAIGRDRRAPMDDWIAIGAFAASEQPGGALGEPVYLARHRIESGEQTIGITLPRRPVRAGIDPYHLLIERVHDDNVVEVEAP